MFFKYLGRRGNDVALVFFSLFNTTVCTLSQAISKHLVLGKIFLSVEKVRRRVIGKCLTFCDVFLLLNVVWQMLVEYKTCVIRRLFKNTSVLAFWFWMSKDCGMPPHKVTLGLVSIEHILQSHFSFTDRDDCKKKIIVKILRTFLIYY